MPENNKQLLLVKTYSAKYIFFILDQHINDSVTKIKLENNKLSLLVENI